MESVKGIRAAFGFFGGNRAILILAPLALLLGAVGPANADTFVNPPEVYWNPPWWSTFPYQRNIYWNFNVNPVGGPSPSGTPGAVYEGSFDPSLMSSDTFALSGAATYYPLVTVFNPDTSAYDTYTDAIGIVNNTASAVTGVLDIHLDNLPPTPREKDIYWEDTGASNGASATLTAVVGDTVYPSTLVTVSQIGTSPELWREDLGIVVTPNPDAEDVVVNYTVQPGGYDLITTLHIATECPEPSTIALLGIGALGLLRRPRKLA
jgi:hypothetical protein